MANDDGLVLKSYKALKETLMVNEQLRVEYGRVKFELCLEEYGTIMQYAAKKRPTIRKILKQAGWYVFGEFLSIKCN